MTRDEIKTMREQNPREFDALVAEKVMGWKRYHFIGGKRNPNFQFIRQLDPEYVAGVVEECSETLPWFNDEPRCPNYTDPAADYAVLEHVRETWRCHEAEAFNKHITDIVQERWCNRDMATVNMNYPTIIDYLPGDYAEAALTVVMEASNA